MKKKKKKKKNMAEFEAELAEQEGEDQDEKKGDVKEKKDEAWLNSDRDYHYDEVCDHNGSDQVLWHLLCRWLTLRLSQLLSRVFKILRQNNPELAGEKKRYTIVPPSIHRDGSKKTVFSNVADICKR